MRLQFYIYTAFCYSWTYVEPRPLYGITCYSLHGTTPICRVSAVGIKMGNCTCILADMEPHPLIRALIHLLSSGIYITYILRTSIIISKLSVADGTILENCTWTFKIWLLTPASALINLGHIQIAVWVSGSCG